MLYSRQDPKAGIIPRTLHQLFERLEGQVTVLSKTLPCISLQSTDRQTDKMSETYYQEQRRLPVATAEETLFQTDRQSASSRCMQKRMHLQAFCNDFVPCIHSRPDLSCRFSFFPFSDTSEVTPVWCHWPWSWCQNCTSFVKLVVILYWNGHLF